MAGLALLNICQRRGDYCERAWNGGRPMNAPTNPTLEELQPDSRDPLTGSAQQLGDDYKTPEGHFEDSEPEFDVTQHFDPIDDGKPSQPSGRPDDYPGYES